MTDTGALSGRTALITGASRGIGAAVAKRFAAEGAHVILFNYMLPKASDRARESGTRSSRQVHQECAGCSWTMEAELWAVLRSDPQLRGVGIHAANVLTPKSKVSTPEEVENYNRTFVAGLHKSLASRLLRVWRSARIAHAKGSHSHLVSSSRR